MRHYKTINGNEAALLIVIPTLNEQSYIKQTIESIIEQSENFRYTIVVADGGSNDETLNIVHDLQERYGSIHLVQNKKVIQSSAVNQVARSNFDGNILVRVDAHAHYPTNFLQDCFKALCDQKVSSIVVPMKTVGITRIQKCIAFAQNMWLGTGGSDHRRINSKSKLVDHGHHAFIWRADFVALGGYNEDFSHNEDAEFDYRLRRNGSLIWMCSEAAIEYYPRTTFSALWRQYTKHGAGRARTIILHRLRPRLRQVIPLTFVSASVLSILLSSIYPYAVLVLCIHLSAYILMSIINAARFKDASLLGVGLAAATMHFAWTFGFICEVTKKLMTKLRY